MVRCGAVKRYELTQSLSVDALSIFSDADDATSGPEMLTHATKSSPLPDSPERVREAGRAKARSRPARPWWACTPCASSSVFSSSDAHGIGTRFTVQSVTVHDGSGR